MWCPFASYYPCDSVHTPKRGVMGLQSLGSGGYSSWCFDEHPLFPWRGSMVIGTLHMLDLLIALYIVMLTLLLDIDSQQMIQTHLCVCMFMHLLKALLFMLFCAVGFVCRDVPAVQT
eukprot:scpid108966/ scgid34201/ 